MKCVCCKTEFNNVDGHLRKQWHSWEQFWWSMSSFLCWNTFAYAVRSSESLQSPIRMVIVSHWDVWNKYISMIKLMHSDGSLFTVEEQVLVFKSKWDVRIYELGSRNYDISCVQVTLVEVRWWCTYSKNKKNGKSSAEWLINVHQECFALCLFSWWREK